MLVSLLKLFFALILLWTHFTWFIPQSFSWSKFSSKSLQPFWISQEPVKHSWYNFATNQRGPNLRTHEHSPIGSVSRETLLRECMSCVVIAFILTMYLPTHHVSCWLFLAKYCVTYACQTLYNFWLCLAKNAFERQQNV